MAFPRNFDLISLAYISDEIIQTILVPQLSAVVTGYALPDPTYTLGQKLSIHVTWYAKQLHSIGSFSYQTTVRRNKLIELHQRIEPSGCSAPAMMIRLEQALRLDRRHNHQIGFVQALTARVPQPYEKFVILAPGEFRREETYS